MSLYGALNIGVAGLAANSQALSATSSNIANVNTVGYKDRHHHFLDLPELQCRADRQRLAGVVAVLGQDVTTQGLPTSTSSPTDMSISGNGFFVVSPTPASTTTQEYTRAGSFTPDANGNLVNAAGLYLLGWQAGFRGQYPHQHQRPQPDQHLEPVGQGAGHQPDRHAGQSAVQRDRRCRPMPRATWRRAR